MAAEVLADVEVWRLDRRTWDVVGHGLRAMQEALVAGNPVGFQQAVGDIEMAGPYRISGLEESLLLPLPEEHRERLNELVHALDTDSPPCRDDLDAGMAGPDASG